jgi:hypothetical protein
MDVVHYAFCGIFGTRTVLVERLNVNLETERLFVYDFPKEETFSPEAVISRAKQRGSEYTTESIVNYIHAGSVQRYYSG